MKTIRDNLAIKKSDLLMCFSMFVFLLYVFSMDLTSRIFIYGTYSIPLAFILSLAILQRYSFTKIYYLDYIDILVFLMLAFIAYNNQNLKNGQVYQIIFTFAFFSFYIIAKKFSRWHKYFFNIIIIFGLFYAFMTYFCMISPSFFRGVVMPLFENIGYSEQMLQLYNQGYQTGFTAHYSTNAIYLTSALSVPIAYILNSKGKILSKNICYFLFIFVALLLTGKRSHIIFGILAFLVAYYYINPEKTVNKLFKILLIIAIGGSIFVIVSDFFPPLANFINRFIESANSGDISSGRTTQRAYAMLLFKDNPWLGIGWDGYKYTYLSVFDIYINVHCVYVQLLCEIGILGAIPFFLFFALSLYHIIKAAKRINKYERNNYSAKLYISFALYYQVFFLLYCITGNPLYDACTLFLYIMSCAIGYYYYSYLKKNYGG